jgi:hypothetical protein
VAREVTIKWEWIVLPTLRFLVSADSFKSLMRSRGEEGETAFGLSRNGACRNGT